MQKIQKYKLFFCLGLVIFLLTYTWLPHNGSFRKRAYAAGDSVTVEGRVGFSPILIVYPEKRVPLTNHWMNQNIVEVRQLNSTTPIVTQVLNFDANGTARLNVVDTSTLPPGTYDISIKGYSHLREVYQGYTFYANSPTFNLALTGRELKAGDTNEDNYINSLDLSFLVTGLYSTSNIKGDLNRDGVINSLDVSNSVVNLYLMGDS